MFGRARWHAGGVQIAVLGALKLMVYSHGLHYSGPVAALLRHQLQSHLILAQTTQVDTKRKGLPIVVYLAGEFAKPEPWPMIGDGLPVFYQVPRQLRRPFLTTGDHRQVEV